MTMEFIGSLLERCSEYGERPAVVWRDQPWSYRWLSEAISACLSRLTESGIAAGSVVSLEADFSPEAIAWLLALVEARAVVVPLTASVETKKPEFREIAEVEWVVSLDAADRVDLARTTRRAGHALYEPLRSGHRPGLILFSSGSTGKSKAALHDFGRILTKFEHRRPAWRTLVFLLFDHIGGVNTLLHTLYNGGTVVTVAERTADGVSSAIERHKVELLPTSPTFINLLLLSGAVERHDLSSLQVITYGTEPMPPATLARLREVLPSVRLQQTYGLSEVGILRSQSRSSDSLWVRLGGEGFQTRVVDGLLEIKAESAMLGYLNASSPFTEDGWFRTGDAVDIDGDYFLIRGRRSELINVGGEKVYPTEIESILQAMDGVLDVTVTGMPNPLTGQIISARVRLSTDESLPEFRQRMFAHCRERIPRWKIPQRVELVSREMHGGRFKKLRAAGSDA